jgi:hypothetical protein
MMASRILPAGRYWITINHDSNFGTWQGWLDAFKDSIRVETTQSVDAAGSDPAYEFYIFVTSKDLIWERGDIPTVAGPNIKSKADTLDREDPTPDLTDRLHDTISELGNEAKSAAKLLTWIAFIGLGIYAYSQLKKTPNSQKGRQKA